MIGISNEELANADFLGDTVQCPRCFVPHDVETSYGDKSGIELHFYKCNGTAYLCGMNGRSMMDRFSRPEKRKR